MSRLAAACSLVISVEDSIHSKGAILAVLRTASPIVDPDAVDLAPFQSDAQAAASDDGLNLRAYRVLREAILSGAFAPGAHLNIRPLAVQLGMSPMPVREALARLRSDGALETLPNRAFRIPVLAVATFRDILLTRIRVEALACEQAAIRASVQDVVAVAALFDDLTAAERGKPDRYLRLHRNFHFAIYALAGMPVLVDIIEGLWLRIGPLILASSRERMAVDRNHHGAILRALRASDPTAIALALRDDIADGLAPVSAYLAGQADAGALRHAV
ncbi:GntR family transcriptional regulator [Lichenihabitans psoromatis]|uniref:GntR family transcriptional regulator n=1 Tax=Lichenihabitans psoromatis TaxID=2528642 RepID=UPI001035D5B7|nr:GntR family transcriptional regulator [Lichenihabitans psoromatis]